MLNMNVPFKEIIMEISADNLAKIPNAKLPNGFSFTFYKNGMEKDWAKIMTSVMEFEKEEEAMKIFEESFLPFPEKLKERCLFVLNSDGEVVGTATAWLYENDSKYGYQPRLHWISVKTEYQGLGLGKALIQKTAELFREKDSGFDAILHTQTWSDKAILAYLGQGYVFSKTKMANENLSFDEALDVLKTLYSAKIIEQIIATAK